jgi:hypothetical protein
VVSYRRTFLDTLVREGEDEAEQVREEYTKADARTQEKYEDTGAAVESKRRLSNDEESELKNLWRKLVKLFHPDRFADDPEKMATYTKLTGTINAAKDSGDLETLRQIAPHQPRQRRKPIAHGFNRGDRMSAKGEVPAGTKGAFFRPCRDSLLVPRLPTDKSVGYFVSSLRDCIRFICPASCMTRTTAKTLQQPGGRNHRRHRGNPRAQGKPDYELYQITEQEPEVFERMVEQQIAGIAEELTQFKTEAERLKKEIVELGGEDAAVVG